MSENEPDVFDAIVKMCSRLGVRNISTLDGCWTYKIDDEWWVAVNGQTTPQTAISPTDIEFNRQGTEVDPFTAYIEYNGWPAGIVDPYGGTFAAGDAANAETFVAACEKIGVPA